MGELEIAYKKAWSVESKEKHDCKGSLSYIGEMEKAGCHFKFYKDEAGQYFYESDAGKDLTKRQKERGRSRGYRPLHG